MDIDDQAGWDLAELIAKAMRPSEVVGKPSRAPGEQGARRRETGVYTRVHEDFEPPSNAVIPSAVGFTTASKEDIPDARINNLPTDVGHDGRIHGTISTSRR